MRRYTPGRGDWSDPFQELRYLQNEMNRLFGDYVTTGETSDYPPINLWTGEEGVVASAEIPGVSPDDLEITVQENTLTLKGERRPPEVGESVTFHRRERAYGGFSRTVMLPFNVDPDQVQARFDDGILMVKLPRPEAERPRRIKIQTA
jgi:HSP20 family protein